MEKIEKSFAPTAETEDPICAACGNIADAVWESASFSDLELPIVLGGEKTYIPMEHLEFYMNTFGFIEVR